MRSPRRPQRSLGGGEVELIHTETITNLKLYTYLVAWKFALKAHNKSVILPVVDQHEAEILITRNSDAFAPVRQHCATRVVRLGAGRENFRDDSDVDLLATLRGDAHPTLLDWADMQEKLAELFGRPVDLVSRRAIESSRNRYRKHSIHSQPQRPALCGRITPIWRIFWKQPKPSNASRTEFRARLLWPTRKKYGGRESQVRDHRRGRASAFSRSSQSFSRNAWKLITAMRNILIHDYDDVGSGCGLEYNSTRHSAAANSSGSPSRRKILRRNPKFINTKSKT